MQGPSELGASGKLVELGPHRRPRQDHGADAGHRRAPRHDGPGAHGDGWRAQVPQRALPATARTAATWRCTTTRRPISTGSSASCATWMRGAPPASDDFQAMLARVDAAQLELQNGRAAAFKGLWSRADDVTLSGGFGGKIERGWDAVGRRLDWVGTQFSERQDHARAHRFERERRSGIPGASSSTSSSRSPGRRRNRGRTTGSPWCSGASPTAGGSSTGRPIQT